MHCLCRRWKIMSLFFKMFLLPCLYLKHIVESPQYCEIQSMNNPVKKLLFLLNLLNQDLRMVVYLGLTYIQNRTEIYELCIVDWCVNPTHTCLLSHRMQVRNEWRHRVLSLFALLADVYTSALRWANSIDCVSRVFDLITVAGHTVMTTDNNDFRSMARNVYYLFSFIIKMSLYYL